MPAQWAATSPPGHRTLTLTGELQCPQRPVPSRQRARTRYSPGSWKTSAGTSIVRADPTSLPQRSSSSYQPRRPMAFFAWLDGRYPGWRMPHLFFMVKAGTAFRIEDICSLRSDQLEDGRLVFTADTTKNRSERYAVLPADLYAELEGYKGGTYLWERYPAELIAVNRKKGVPTHRQNPAFAPRRLYLWIVALMQEYQKKTGQDLSSHDFRKAAFTRAAEEDIHPKRAAVAFDVTPETMMKYYTATEKKKTADEVLGELQARLFPGKRAQPRQEE
jgi:integrase